MSLPRCLSLVPAILVLASHVQPCVAAEANVADRQTTASAHAADTWAHRQDLRGAMRSALGCGGAIEKERLMAIRKVLLPMWETLPKTNLGRVGHRSLRYVAHRYFIKRFGIVIRGFEPSRPMNESHWGAVGILNHEMPWYVEVALASQHAETHGFGLSDAVYLVVALEELLLESERTLLERVYVERSGTAAWPLNQSDLKALLKSYLLRWLLGGAEEAQKVFANNETLLKASFPMWSDLSAFAEGQIRAFDYMRYRGQRRRHGGNALTQGYSFDDAYEIVRTITESFASFWTSECMVTEEFLATLDKRGIGRVSLKKFYAAALSSGRVTESEAYLRELGVLDESSLMKQLVIPNFVQSLSSCPVSTPHYFVCCPNRCDAIHAEVEATILAPVASATAVAAAVQSLLEEAFLDDEDAEDVSIIGGHLMGLLERIAAENGGQVRLHGRLFAQWLHYAFPRECPFPRKASGAWRLPSEFGEGAMASEEEVLEHSRDPMDDFVDELFDSVPKEDDDAWMSQWEHEEELAVEHEFGHGSGMPWQPQDQREQRLGAEHAARHNESERFEADSFEAHRDQRLGDRLRMMSGKVSALVFLAGFCVVAAFGSFWLGAKPRGNMLGDRRFEHPRVCV